MCAGVCGNLSEQRRWVLTCTLSWCNLILCGTVYMLGIGCIFCTGGMCCGFAVGLSGLNPGSGNFRAMT